MVDCFDVENFGQRVGKIWEGHDFYDN